MQDTRDRSPQELCEGEDLAGASLSWERRLLGYSADFFFLLRASSVPGSAQQRKPVS